MFWFRRDLRLDDNAGLYYALKAAEGRSLLPLFIFDKSILGQLADRDDARVTFIHQSLERLANELKDFGLPLTTYFGTPSEVFSRLINTIKVEAVFTNHDYEPSAIKRDAEIKSLLEKQDVQFHTFKDQCLFEKSEVCKDDGDPYTIFTPYKNKWLKVLTPFYYKSYPSRELISKSKFQTASHEGLPAQVMALGEFGFKASELPMPERKLQPLKLKKYDELRNYPALDGTSHIGIHLRFGTLSIRRCVQLALKTNQIWLSELIWRDFFMQILFHYPHVVDAPFRPAYSKIQWRNNKAEFEKWCAGETGYRMVDAGMRELNQTGHMHNRVRMVVASFLTKHLLIDWRWGERYFARKLLDYDLSANNGNWQWAAGTGCDAAPYFRVFNPEEQQKKFDSKFEYIQKWVPEYLSSAYANCKIVDHKTARVRAIAAYAKAVKA